MRPQLLKVSKGPDRSFSVRRNLVPHVNNRWHYHSEVELIHCKKGEGTQFIGNNIKRFKAGDVVLVGSNLPHYWRFDEAYFEENASSKSDVRVAHFSEGFWGKLFNSIYEYSIKNFKRKIHLEEIAEVANISPNSFCRYFKSRTRKTYSRFLIELRVGHACKLLIENTHCFKRLCYESGFNNFTSFHKYFKTITGKTPLAYRKEFTS